jgi:uncharacterized integral membrane protein
MISLFRTLFFWTLAAAVAVIAVANRDLVTLSFDPFNSSAPAVMFELRQFWIILGAGLIGILLGGWSTWLSQAPVRRALREAEEKIRRLEREIEVGQTIVVRPAARPGRALEHV